MAVDLALLKPGDWLRDLANPGRPGQFTSRTSKAGPLTLIELFYSDGSTAFRPLNMLELMPKSETIESRLMKGHFGSTGDLKRVITYEKLKGSLHEVIYSMEAAQIDFYPYQFKPVMKIISAPTERLILADEVGLGKTIESALIWLELQARKQARRLLVVCPKTLAEKWRDELRHKFLIDARMVDFYGLRDEMKVLREQGQSHAFSLIGTYTGLRPPKSELRLLDEPPDQKQKGTPKTEFLRELRHYTEDYELFDLVIFDEAHYMRNPATTTFHLGEALSACAAAVLCVSATPVNNSNTDLHSLLRLVDESFFESQGLFEELLHANKPAVQASNVLAGVQIDMAMLAKAIEQMGESRFIQGTPLFKEFRDLARRLSPEDKAAIARCQSLAESLNLLGGYVNRTRRLQVKEHRPLRAPLVLQVEYSKEEMQLYNMILRLVRARCRLDSRAFHVFQIIGLQLRAASCLPVLAREIEEGRFGNPTELMSEAFGEEICDDLFEDPLQEESGLEGLDTLLRYDFEKNDSKYLQLRTLLNEEEEVADDKVIIFAYYRPTLAYLARRLGEDGITFTSIHGGVPPDKRWEELDRFSNPKGPRVLLSSEVGSEGIDLQFCRVLVNYDLPWNPMRVEQRIGRIDRVGQTAKKLAIVNFKVRNTIEERLYERLHSKLALFANTLGDLEPVIGREVQQLTVDLLSKDLTPEEEKIRIEQTEAALENQLLEIQRLEQSGDTLLALSDYLQRQIDEVRGKGRYMQPDELEDYVSDFFEREFQGCEVDHGTPAPGCLRVRLTPEAQASLSRFVVNDRSVSAGRFRQREFAVTFRREVMKRLTPAQKQRVLFINHLSPFVRWITEVNRDGSHSLYNVSALTLTDTALPLGPYCYYIERWKMTGVVSRERLAYAIVPLEGGQPIEAETAEETVQRLLRRGRDWNYTDCSVDSVVEAYKAAERDLCTRFDTAVTEFEAENATTLQIRKERVRGFFERRIKQDQQRLETLMLHNPNSPVVRAAKGRIEAAKRNREEKLAELQKKASIDVEKSPIAAGIFRVIAQVSA